MNEIKILSVAVSYGPNPMTSIAFQILEIVGQVKVVREELSVDVSKEVNVNNTSEIKEEVRIALIGSPWELAQPQPV